MIIIRSWRFQQYVSDKDNYICECSWPEWCCAWDFLKIQYPNIDFTFYRRHLEAFFNYRNISGSEE